MTSERTTVASSVNDAVAHARSGGPTEARDRLTWRNLKNTLSEELYENPTGRGLAYLFRDLAMFVVCFSLLYAVDQWYFLLPLWILSGLILAGLFALGHDLAHGSLFKSRRLTYWAGLISFLPTLVPFRQFVHGHNRHHGHTVEMEGDFVWRPTTPHEYFALSLPRRVLHRLYWSAFGAGWYYLIEIWYGDLMAGKAGNRGARIDRAIVVVFVAGVSAALFYFGGRADAVGAGFDVAAGLWTWTRVFFVPFMIWNYLAGITLYLQHIHESMPWKTSGEWTALYAQFFGTTTYRVPGVLNFFIHNVYIHMPHHVQIRIPFYHLPAALRQMQAAWGDLMHESDRPVRDYLRIVRSCKLFDPATGRWYTYGAARRRFFSPLRELSAERNFRKPA